MLVDNIVPLIIVLAFIGFAAVGLAFAILKGVWKIICVVIPLVWAQLRGAKENFFPQID
jgi:hypothetical protein